MRTPRSWIRSSKAKAASVSEAVLHEELSELCEKRAGDRAWTSEGRSLQVRALPKKQGFVIAVPCPRAGRFRVTRQGALDRWMADFVPAWRFRSYDERFDRQFNVRTRDREVAAAALARPPGRSAVEQLFELGAHVVSLEWDRVEAVLPAKAIGDLAPAEVAETILDIRDELGAIATSVEAFSRRHEVHPAPKVDLGLGLTVSILGLLGLLGFVLLIAATTQFTLVRPAAILPLCAAIGLPAIFPAVFAIALAVQHRTAPYSLVRGLSALALVIMPLFVSAAIAFSNGAFDSTPATEHRVVVLDKSMRRDKNGVHFQIALASWWTEGEVRWVPTSSRVFDQIEPGTSHLRVRTHPGRLGYEWIESTHFDPRHDR